MKKGIFLMLVCLLLIGLSACTTSKAEDVKQSNTQQPEEPKLTAFEQFEKGLDAKGITYEKVVMASELVGAVEGYKYKFNGGSAELYRFDKDSEALKIATENKSLYLEGFGSFPALINGNLALMTDGESIKEIAEKTFSEIK